MAKYVFLNMPAYVHVNPTKEAVNTTTLREAVERVADDPAFRERVQYMQQVTHEAGGYRRAADAIMQFSLSRQS